ncbi:DUF3592 domain-containing protein [Streptacidiphilus sp. ASG 303]|uniref:DUF3592 domain-containing protein n=1 Tax=Streptacidiphilus sp. ASG 303 TaxID=2896847 RepID=UPI001E5FE2C2|nr:DUF3592 domain-containing protein [Streptacidiphilus sp. ASG 303]MCD0482442.1 DUF3592 domain-containing protein [Streptacidiphilus sp. ASG 303]
METPTAVAAGTVFVLFGGALLWWCAAEALLRRRLRRHGVPAVARVLADRGPAEADDPAPALAYATADRDAPVVSRPRGRTPLRRPARLSPGTLVPVVHDPLHPGRTAVADGLRTAPTDVFWTILGAASLAAGLALVLSAAGR